MLVGNEVLRIDMDKQQQTAIAVESGATGLFTVDSGRIRVVYPAKVEYFSFEA